MKSAFLPLIALALASPALAQEPASATITAMDVVTAQSKTIDELKSSWLNARITIEAEKRERIAAQQQLAKLQASQAPPAALPPPPGMGVATPEPGPTVITPGPTPEITP